MNLRFGVYEFTSIKDVRTQGRGVFAQCGYFLDKRGGVGSSDASIRYFDAKIFGFFKIYGVSARKGVKPVRTRGEEVNFSQFCADILYGQPLT